MSASPPPTTPPTTTTSPATTTTTTEPSPPTQAEVAVAEGKIAVAVTVAALLAGLLLIGGLVVDALEVQAAPAVLRAGAFVLLAVPLVRNAAVLVVDERRPARLLAILLSVGLGVIYTFAFLAPLE